VLEAFGRTETVTLDTSWITSTDVFIVAIIMRMLPYRPCSLLVQIAL
jgi:hypothetical protein